MKILSTRTLTKNIGGGFKAKKLAVGNLYLILLGKPSHFKFKSDIKQYHFQKSERIIADTMPGH